MAGGGRWGGSLSLMININRLTTLGWEAGFPFFLLLLLLNLVKGFLSWHWPPWACLV